MSLQPAQRAFMRDWLSSCISKLQTQPPSIRRDGMIAELERSLDRYSEPNRPTLRIIKGGRP